MVCDRCGKDIEGSAVRQENDRGVLSFHPSCFTLFLKDGKLHEQAPNTATDQKPDSDWDPYGFGGYPGFPLM